MTSSNADRNLLFGILALQMDFVSRDQLVAAMHAWVMNKSKPLGQILREQNALADDRHTLLEALVQEHLKQHGNDPEKSLAAVSPNLVREELLRIADPDVQASLRRVPAPRPEQQDPYGTVVRSVGAPSATGLRFRILRPHAKGGLGEVHVAHDEELHREVVVKQIQQQHADDPESRSRFLLEAEITGGLEHPGIVPVYSLGHYADGRPYYAMRFVRGDSLKDAIERFHRQEVAGRDPGERTLEFRKLLGRMIDVCQAIAYAHSRSVLHRDLKPGNIMLGKYGETLVVDWGLAKPLDREMEEGPGSEEGKLTLTSASSQTPTMVGTALGTPQFMSPEQAAGRLEQLGPASDVYSLGATLYCLLTGKSPFPDADVGEVLQKVQRGDFAPPRQINSNVPRALEAACLKAMALKPQERYPTPQLLAEDLEHWLADEPVSAWREPWTDRAKRWLRRHQTLAVGIASAVLVAMVGLAVATVLLTAAHERERQAKNKAQENFRMAQEAVDRYLTEVSENTLLREPGMEPLRHRLLEAAREFYDRFVKERSDDPTLRGELAKALFRLAQITGEIEADGKKKAVELHEQALRIFLDQGAEYQVELARCYHHLGRLYRVNDQLTKSEEAYQKALAIWEALAAQDATYRAELARSRLNLGILYQFQRHYEPAHNELLKARAIWEPLAQGKSADPQHRRDLGVSNDNLGRVFEGLGKIDEARASFKDAIAILTPLVREHANLSRYADDLARSHYNLGDLLFRERDYEGALQECQAAAAVWDRLVQIHPDVHDYQTQRADAYATLADVYRKQNKLAKAVEASRQALASLRELAARNSSVPKYRGDLARGWFVLGDIHRDADDYRSSENAYLEAIKLHEELVKELDEVPQYQADLARSYTNLGRLRQQHNQHGPAEEALAKAVALWQRLHRDRPEAVEFLVGLSASCGGMRFLIAAGGSRGSVELFSQVIAGLKETPAKAQGPEFAQALTQCYAGRAEARTRHRQFAEALTDWDEAIKSASDFERPWLKIARLVTLVRSGDHMQATGGAEEFLTKVRIKGSGGAFYQLASVYALAVEVVTKDARLQPDAARELADKHGKRMLELLTKARDTGYFLVPANLAKLTRHADFEYVRGRADYQQFVRDLKPGSPGKSQ